MHGSSGIRYRLSATLIRVASWFVPRKTRTTWRRQWRAELEHRWQRSTAGEHDASRHGVVLWSLGAFSHAWYLLRTEFTMDLIWQDIRYAFRSLRHGPGLIVMAVASLGLGIGANATIFSAVDVFMFRPLPYPDSDRIVRIFTSNEERGWSRASVSKPDFLDFRDMSRSMDVTAIRGQSYNLSGDGLPERLFGHSVTANFFDVVGIQPSVGRGFLPEEENAGRGHVVILEHGVWQRRFGGDSALIGASIALDGVTHTVVGVMPAGFWFETRDVDLWTPLTTSVPENRNRHSLSVYARLRETASPEDALADLQQITRRISDQYPETSAGNSAVMVGLHSYLYDENFRLGTTIASVAVALVLLIACANVANLLLTRAAGRRREMALRGALGAGRSRIVRQLLFESLMIAGIGGVIGIVLSIGGIRGLVSWMPDWFPRIEEIALNGRVLLFTAVVSSITGIIFGMAPALQSSKPNLTDPLKEGGRAGAGATATRVRRFLVIGEIALSFVLLVSSTLLVQGFARIRLADLGLDASDVLAMSITLPENHYADSGRVRQFWTDYRTRLEGSPGVVSVSATTLLPLRGNSGTYYGLSADDLNEPRPNVVSYRAVEADYFTTLDIPVLEGRGIQQSDQPGTITVAVINQAFAARHWPDGDAVGQQFFFHSGPRTIVGIVANSLDQGPDTGPRPMVFVAAQQSMVRTLSWIVETTNDPNGLMEPARRAVHELDPMIPVYNMTHLGIMLDEIVGQDAIMARVMSALAVIALVLAIGGVYGIMAFTISQRTHEMGIRLALGAKHQDVVRLVVGQGAVLSLIGLSIGLGIGVVVTRSLSAFLYGISPFDPTTFAAVTVALLAAGLVASYVPARRTTKIDPISALRTE